MARKPVGPGASRIGIDDAGDLRRCVLEDQVHAGRAGVSAKCRDRAFGPLAGIVVMPEFGSCRRWDSVILTLGTTEPVFTSYAKTTQLVLMIRFSSKLLGGAVMAGTSSCAVTD